MTGHEKSELERELLSIEAGQLNFRDCSYLDLY